MKVSPIVDLPHFHRMAFGDLAGLRELADEFFESTKAQISLWEQLRIEGRHEQLREEFHRCRGGASIFGFSRITGLLHLWETHSEIEIGQQDLEQFSRELEAAEQALSTLLP